MLQQGKVYYVSKMAIKPAIKQFNAIAHEYELYFEHGTEIALVRSSFYTKRKSIENSARQRTIQEVSPR